MIDRTNRTIILLCDALPEGDTAEYDFIRHVCTDAGYAVREITVAELCETAQMTALASFMMIVPNCRNLPIETRNALSRYNRTNGSVLFIGGPLYYNLVERDETGAFVKKPLENVLDAGFTVHDPFIREGIAPSYKTYNTKGIVRAVTSSGQCIYDGELTLPGAQSVTVPCETFMGVGYNTDAICRFIPLADCYGEDEPDAIKRGRCGGRRGSLAFIELERTMSDGYEGRAVYGMVESTAIGSAAAQIGIRCGLHRIGGADVLLKSILERFRMGLYLFEGGADGIRYRAGESMKVGMHVLNTTFRFKRVTCRVRVETAGEPIVFEESRLLSPKCITPVEFCIDYEKMAAAGIEIDEEQKISTELIADGAVIDRIDSIYSFEAPEAVTDPAAYVRAQGDRFSLDGKPWYMAGINYWSTYSPSREKRYYWMGMFDKSNYDAATVEADLAYMEAMGLNCVLIRIDFTDFARVIHGVRDFLTRCTRHNIRVWLAYTKGTASKFYCAEAVEEFFSKVFVANNPTVMALDIEWESHPDHYDNKNARREFFDEWEEWLIEKYGSLEAAQKALDVTFTRDIYGYVEYPTVWSAKVHAAQRSFGNDCIDKYWHALSKHLRPLVPHQMLTFRLGGSIPYGRAQAADYIDFAPLEIYNNANLDFFRENMVAICSVASQMHKYETGGKPVVWAEYGYSTCGMKWMNKFYYDHDNQKYLDREVAIQTDFNHRMELVVDEADCAGSAPWWWCGGFRLTEMCDCGFVMPDGLPNESCLSYIEFCRRMKKKLAAGIRDTREEVILEANVDEYVRGKQEFITNKCLDAYYKAREAGKKLVVHGIYDM